MLSRVAVAAERWFLSGTQLYLDNKKKLNMKIVFINCKIQQFPFQAQTTTGYLSQMSNNI